MVSETSCEFGNRLLDRGMVASLPNSGATGYLALVSSSGDTIPNCLGEFREIRESNERTSVAA